MLKNYDITFKKGSILTGCMLSLMNEVPKTIIDLLFENRTDGIISGMDIMSKNNELIVSPGIYKKNGQIYYLDNEEIFSISAKEEMNYKLIITSVKDELLENCINEKKCELKLVNSSEVISSEDDILCEFWTSPKLPKTYKELFLGSCVDLIKCNYSGSGEKTYYPYVFSLILEKIKNKKNKHPLDYSLINTIYSEGVLSKNLIKTYISETGTIIEEENDKKLLKEFLNSIDNLLFVCSVSQTEDITKKNDKIVDTRITVMK